MYAEATRKKCSSIYKNTSICPQHAYIPSTLLISVFLFLFFFSLTPSTDVASNMGTVGIDNYSSL